MSSYDLKPGAPVDNRFSEFLNGIKLWNLYSQNCEDSILAAIFDRIGTENRWCFECGAADGLFFSNTQRLIDQGWNAILVECDTADFGKLSDKFHSSPKVHTANVFLVAEERPGSEQACEVLTLDDARKINCFTLDQTLAMYGAPRDLDLLVLDLDSQEYYVLNAMVRFRPRVLIVEYDPDAAPMFIPELRGKGQAGHLAMRYVAEARGYEVIGKTPTNLICVRRDLASQLESKPVAQVAPAQPAQMADLAGRPITREEIQAVIDRAGSQARQGAMPATRQQVRANGRWQDINAPEIFVHESELEDANAGKLQTRIVEVEQRAVRIAVAMSLPRQGYLDAYDSIIASTQGADRFLGWGVSWSHALTRSIERALLTDDDKGEGYDFILTADYDTFAPQGTLLRMAQLLARNPDVDCIVPLQCKRATDEILIGGENMNLAHELVQIDAGHFGFTLFRAESFAKLEKPWLLEVPDEHGSWGPGRTDWDIYFWQNAKRAGWKVMFAPGVVVGHGQEFVSWPRVSRAGKITTINQPVSEWAGSRQMPEGAGVVL